jgi:D-glucosaminate-6-phosphate ammonia-lyase
MHIYQRLGLRRVINADARLTRLGGSIMPPEVLAAMAEAAQWYVDIFELQRAVGRRIAELTQNEAAYVCTGASAGLFLATLACLTGSDLKAISRLVDEMPDPILSKDEVIIHTAHRIPYDPAIRLAGARLVEIGNVLQTFPWELEAAITERTAAVVYMAGEHLSRGALPLPQVIEIAHAYGIPVIVDAAAQLPPPENLWRFTRDLGADLAIFSGGKDLRGPQASGLILGRADLIEAVFHHGAPHQRLGRPMKVGREEMIGLLTALELYLQQDHTARIARFEAIVQGWVEQFNRLPGASARRDFPNEAGQPVPRLLLELDSERAGLTGAELRQRLWEGDPRIAVAPAGERGVYITPDTLEPGEEELIAERVTAIVQAAAGRAVGG